MSNDFSGGLRGLRPPTTFFATLRVALKSVNNIVPLKTYAETTSWSGNSHLRNSGSGCLSVVRHRCLGDGQKRSERDGPRLHGSDGSRPDEHRTDSGNGRGGIDGHVIHRVLLLFPDSNSFPRLQSLVVPQRSHRIDP